MDRISFRYENLTYFYIRETKKQLLIFKRIIFWF
jgi:hypothetical protein